MSSISTLLTTAIRTFRQQRLYSQSRLAIPGGSVAVGRIAPNIWWKERRLRLAVLLAALLIVCIPTTALADSTDSKKTDLDTLEDRFFDTTYPQDTETQRLDRLDKLVFGELHSGSDDERLSNLLSTVPKADLQPPSDQSSAATAPTDGTAGSSSDNTAQAPSDAGAGSDSSNGGYPSVSALESEFFGKSFPNESITQRLSQLESKAFGHPVNVTDLSQRVAALEQYAEARHLVPSGQQLMPYDESGRYAVPLLQGFPPPPAESPLETRIAWLEQQSLGATYPGLSLLDRIRQLQARILPSEQGNDAEPLGDQVDMLVNAFLLSHHGSATPAQTFAAPRGAQIQITPEGVPQGDGVNYYSPSGTPVEPGPPQGFAPSQGAPPYSTAPPANPTAGYGQQEAPPSYLGQAQPYAGSTASYPAPQGGPQQGAPYYPGQAYAGTSPGYLAPPQGGTPQGEPPYGAPPAYGAQFPPQQGYGAPPNASNGDNQSATPPHKEHPLLGGLAKVLRTVGSMSMSGIGYGMGGLGYSGLPGLGYGVPW